jgi:cytochrome b561
MWLRNDALQYGALAKLLHWLMFALLIGSFALGFSMVDLPVSPKRLQWYAYHKWIGITVFLLVIVRLGWRLISPPPPPLPMPHWQRRLVQHVHAGIYLLLFVIPLSGWITSSAYGFKTVYLKLIPLPDLIARNKVLAKQLSQVHELLGFALLTLVALHVLGALKHHLINRDSTLKRMLPFAKVTERDLK